MSTTESIRSKANSTIHTIAASVHCDNPDSLIEKQRKNVIIAVKQARQSENKRLDRLDNHKLSINDREKLLKRFDSERLKEQERISGLMEDFTTLQTIKQQGLLQDHIEHRKYVIEKAKQNHFVNNEDQKLNRFRGLETDMDKIFYADAIKKFEKQDKKFEKKMAPKFDMYAERQRLNLLNEKKNILKQLIQMESSNIRNRFQPPQSNRSSYRDSDTASR